MSNRMWGGRFSSGPDAIMEEINASIGFDHRLYRQDIAGSIAHARMLAASGILTEADRDAIVKGLGDVLAEIESQKFTFSRALEDIRDNLRGLELVYFGPGGGAPGLGSYLRARGKELDPFMTVRFDAAMAAADAVPEPLGFALAEDPRSVVRLIDALDELGRAVQVDILNALATNVGFNDNDGD